MMTEPDAEEGDDPALALALAEKFAHLVKLVGGPAKAAKLAGVGTNTINKWSRGLTKIPFAAVFQLAMEADLSLDRFAGYEGINPAALLDGDYVRVPKLQIGAAAGGGTYAIPVQDDEAGGFFALRERWLRSIGANPRRTEALIAIGDSMEPTIRDGDVLLVDRSIDDIRDNGIYIVVVAGRVVVKRVQIRTNGSVVLRSDNDRYDEEVVPADEVSDLVIEGRVRWFGRTI